MAGDPGGAAAAWADLGCPYERALALADAGGEADLLAALAGLEPRRTPSWSARACARSAPARHAGRAGRRSPTRPASPRASWRSSR
jgi:hypothetical protein